MESCHKLLWPIVKRPDLPLGFVAVSCGVSPASLTVLLHLPLLRPAQEGRRGQLGAVIVDYSVRHHRLHIRVSETKSSDRRWLGPIRQHPRRPRA